MVPAGPAVQLIAGEGTPWPAAQVFAAGILPPSAKPAMVILTMGGRLGPPLPFAPPLPPPLPPLSWAIMAPAPAATISARAIMHRVTRIVCVISSLFTLNNQPILA